MQISIQGKQWVHKMPNGRSAIPADVARQVRIRSGFACVICGCLIVDYEHIVLYSEKPEHDPDNLVLLCVKHHREVTAGRMAKQRVIEASKSPFTIRNNYRFPNYTLEPNNDLKIFAGSTLFLFSAMSGGVNVVSIADEALFSILYDEGFLQFSFKIYDISGDLAVEVKRNQLRICKSHWDVRLSGKYLRVTYKRNLDIIKIRLDNSCVHFEKLAIYNQGCMVMVHQSHFEFCDEQANNLKMSQNLYSVGAGEIYNYIGVNCKLMRRFAHNRTTCGEMQMSEDTYLKYLRKRYPKIKLEHAENRYGPYGYMN